METAITIWMIGFMFTAGLLLDNEDPPLWMLGTMFCFLFGWPLALGVWVSKILAVQKEK